MSTFFSTFFEQFFRWLKVEGWGLRGEEGGWWFVVENQRVGTETEGGIQQAEGRLSARSQGCPGQNATEKKPVKYRKLNSTTANPRNTPPHTKEDPEGEPQGFFFDRGWTRIPQSGTDKGETRIQLAIIRAIRVKHCAPLFSIRVNPCPSVVKNLLRPPLQQRGILLEIRDGDTPSLPR